MTLAVTASLARGAAINLAARLVVVALGLGVLVVVARMGPAVQGAFALFAAAESALLTLFSGLGLLLAREISHRQRDSAGACSAALLASLGLGVVVALAMLAVALVSHSDPYRHLWLMALAAPFLLMVPTAGGLWLGQGRMGAMNLPQVAAPAAVLCALAALPLAGASGIAAVLAAWAVGKALVGAATGLAAARESGFATPRWDDLRAQWRFVALIGITNVVSLLNYRVTLFLLERQGGLAAAGVYSVAVQVGELLWMLSSAVTLSAYARIGAPDRAQAARLTLRAVRINVLVTAAAAPLLWVVARWALPVLLGQAYSQALLPLMLLLPGIAAYAAASSLSAYFTNHRGRPQWSGAVAAFSLALTLAISAWSIPRFGAIGAALATSLAYLIAMSAAFASFLRDAGLSWRCVWSTAPRQ